MIGIRLKNPYTISVNHSKLNLRKLTQFIDQMVWAESERKRMPLIVTQEEMLLVPFNVYIIQGVSKVTPPL